MTLPPASSSPADPWIDDPRVRADSSAAAMVNAALRHARQWQPVTDAFITITAEAAARAPAQDAVQDSGPAGRQRGILDGVPVAVKDNIDVAGLRCTAGSWFFRDRIAQSDAECIRRLRRTGAVVIGKTNMHEFAFGATNDNPFFGRCRNPWQPEHIPGGSSGGSAVAVATDACILALASDTGGSGRIPAAFCGVSGFRPSHGSISCAGVFPVTPSFDTVSVMARHISDISAAVSVISGYDPLDARSALAPVGQPLPDGTATGLRIGMLVTADAADTNREITAAVTAAADVLAEAGHSVTQLQIPGLGQAADTCGTIMKCEALAIHLERMEHEPLRFGDDTRRRLELGREITGAALASAYDYQAEWTRRLELLFAGLDALVLPTSPVLPPLAGSAETLATTAQVARLTYPWSLAGCPALSVPCGLSSEGLPIGLQLVGARFADAALLALAAGFQARTSWHLLRPPALAAMQLG